MSDIGSFVLEELNRGQGAIAILMAFVTVIVSFLMSLLFGWVTREELKKKWKLEELTEERRKPFELMLSAVIPLHVLACVFLILLAGGVGFMSSVYIRRGDYLALGIMHLVVWTPFGVAAWFVFRPKSLVVPYDIKNRISPYPLFPRKDPPRPEVGLRVRYYQGHYSPVPGEFYLDQDCCDQGLIKLLPQHGLKVVTTYQAGNAGADDLAQLKYATSKLMIIITRDRGFVKKHNAGVKHSGIIHAPHGKDWHMEILRVALRLAEEGAKV